MPVTTKPLTQLTPESVADDAEGEHGVLLLVDSTDNTDTVLLTTYVVRYSSTTTTSGGDSTYNYSDAVIHVSPRPRYQ